MSEKPGNPIHDTISMLEGPPLEFYAVSLDGWQFGLLDTPTLQLPSLTRLQTNNPRDLSERCHRAWESGGTMTLLYRNEIGMEQSASIMAIRPVELKASENDMVLVWVYIDPSNYEHIHDV